MEAKIIVILNPVSMMTVWTTEMMLIVKKVRMINLMASSQTKMANHLNKKQIKNSPKKS
jgi:hypothetical protein